MLLKRLTCLPSSLGAFRAGTPIVLDLLDGSVGVDPALHIVWTRFRLMRTYLAYRPLETAHIFWMLDLIAHGAPWPGARTSASHSCCRKLGVSAVESSKVGFVLLFLPSGCLRGQSNIFKALFLKPGSSKLVLSWRKGEEGSGSAVSGYPRIFTTTYIFPPAGKR